MLGGEQARVRQRVPVKMVHVVDTVALVTIDHTGSRGALHIEPPALLELLGDWFDAMWDAPDTTVIGGQPPHELTPVRHKVLTLLASGLTDESIVNHTGTAVARRDIDSAVLTLVRRNCATGCRLVRATLGGPRSARQL